MEIHGPIGAHPPGSGGPVGMSKNDFYNQYLNPIINALHQLENDLAALVNNPTQANFQQFDNDLLAVDGQITSAFNVLSQQQGANAAPLKLELDYVANMLDGIYRQVAIAMNSNPPNMNILQFQSANMQNVVIYGMNTIIPTFQNMPWIDS